MFIVISVLLPGIPYVIGLLLSLLGRQWAIISTVTLQCHPHVAQCHPHVCNVTLMCAMSPSCAQCHPHVRNVTLMRAMSPSCMQCHPHV